MLIFRYSYSMKIQTKHLLVSSLSCSCRNSSECFPSILSFFLNLVYYSRPDRVVPIAERFGMDAGAVLDNVKYLLHPHLIIYCSLFSVLIFLSFLSLLCDQIIYARAYTYEHQYNLLLGLAAKMAEEPFRLLVKATTSTLS